MTAARAANPLGAARSALRRFARRSALGRRAYRRYRRSRLARRRASVVVRVLAPQEAGATARRRWWGPTVRTFVVSPVGAKERPEGARTPDEILEQLVSGRRPDEVHVSPRVDDRTRARLLLSLYWALPVDGSFVLPTPEPDGEVARLLSGVETLAGTADVFLHDVPARERDLADSTRAVHATRSDVRLTKAKRHLVKLREAETDEVLTREYGDWGSVLEVKPATVWQPEATFVSHGEGRPLIGESISVPVRPLRVYRDMTWYGRQVFAKGSHLVPDSFRHQYGQRWLSQRGLVPSHGRMGRPTTPLEPRRTARAKGVFYNFDTEFPGHFGHVTTEVIARWWGWQRAREELGDVRPLFSTYRKGQRLPGFQVQIMQALGIPLEDAYFTHCGRVVRVEQLVAAAPDLENPVYVAPEMREVYARLLAGLPDEGGPRPERLFISRRAEKYAARWCVQTPEIEQWFAARGFEVVYPEDLTYAQQARMFASAKVVAGFAGSGLFNMMFAPDARVVIISGDSYVARNEQLIAAVNGNEVHYFWGSSDLPQGKTFDYRAFKSPFSFDLGRFEPELVDVL